MATTKTIGAALGSTPDLIATARVIAERPNNVALVVESIRWGTGRTSIRVTAGHERLNLTTREAVRLGAALLAAGGRE